MRCNQSPTEFVPMLFPSGNVAESTWGVQVVRYPNFFFSGMEADGNVKVVGGDVAVL